MPEGPGELRTRWLSGDAVAFREVMERHGGMVVTLARRYARDADELEDLVQEIWIRVYRKRHSFEDRGSLLSWILTLAKSACVDAKRRSRIYRSAVDRYAEVPPEGADAEPPAGPDLGGRAAVAVEALARLSYRQREAITHRVLEGLSPEETAKRMGCKKGTIRSLVRNGLMNIRKRMEDMDDPVPEA